MFTCNLLIQYSIKLWNLGRLEFPFFHANFDTHLITIFDRKPLTYDGNNRIFRFIMYFYIDFALYLIKIGHSNQYLYVFKTCTLVQICIDFRVTATVIYHCGLLRDKPWQFWLLIG